MNALKMLSVIRNRTNRPARLILEEVVCRNFYGPLVEIEEVCSKYREMGWKPAWAEDSAQAKLEQSYLPLQEVGLEFEFVRDGEVAKAYTDDGELFMTSWYKVVTTDPAKI